MSKMLSLNFVCKKMVLKIRYSGYWTRGPKTKIQSLRSSAGSSFKSKNTMKSSREDTVCQWFSVWLKNTCEQGSSNMFRRDFDNVSINTRIPLQTLQRSNHQNLKSILLCIPKKTQPSDSTLNSLLLLAASAVTDFQDLNTISVVLITCEIPN